MLITHSYGNYIIQTVLEVWNNNDLEPVLRNIYCQFHPFSMYKYSSNVIEKCFEINVDVALAKFVDDICQKFKLLGKNFLIRFNEK